MENYSAENTQFLNQALQQPTVLGLTYDKVLNPLLKVKINLEQKYLLSFNFFLSKPINEIVFELTKRQVTQAYIDSKIASEQNEYLKRQYHLKTELGVQEIDQRIKMLGEFYNEDQKKKTIYYPMMILTETKSIFEKRNRRYQKICAGEGSSDQTEQKSQFFCYSFDTQHFLKDLSNISQIQNDFNNSQHNLSFDSNVHDIYKQQNFHHKQNATDKSSILKFFDLSVFDLKNSLNHLICEFDDQKQTFHLQKRDDSDQNKNVRPFLEKGRRRPLKISDGINQSQARQIIQERKESEKKMKANYLNIYLNMFQNKYRKLQFNDRNSVLGSTDLKTTRDENQKTDIREIMQIDMIMDRQRQQKSRNRKKIRQKAQELLRRVRTNSQIQ